MVPLFHYSNDLTNGAMIQSCYPAFKTRVTTALTLTLSITALCTR